MPMSRPRRLARVVRLNKARLSTHEAAKAAAHRFGDELLAADAEGIGPSDIALACREAGDRMTKQWAWNLTEKARKRKAGE